MAEPEREVDEAMLAANVEAMRVEHRRLDDTEKQRIDTLKKLGLLFLNCCDTLGGSRELSLAKTHMEEAVMWATKHITR